jgi:medium-chain acyl-[acyl-carrier-protein] hydrolase
MSALASPSAPRRGCLVRLGGPLAPARRLFCVPFAGGGPAAYRLWASDLPADVEVVAVPLPGRNPAGRAAVPDSMDEIVATLLPEVEAATDLPFALFGHSLGALVAFELTAALERSAASSPSHLFVSGRTSPTQVFTGTSVHALADDAFLDALSTRFGGVPDAIRAEPELLALLLPALRADIRTFETYSPLTAHKVRCPVHVYGGAADRHPRPADLSTWQDVAERDVSVRVFPGDHFYLASSRRALTTDIASRWAEVPMPAASS